MDLMLIMNLVQCTHNFEKWDAKGRKDLDTNDTNDFKHCNSLL
jgi:hypothetical protein